MVSTYKQGGVTWIDLENPTVGEVRALVDKYSIDPVVGNELLTPSMRPHIDFHDNYIYLILHFPVTDNSHQGDKEEVDFIIGKEFIITTRYSVVDAVLQFSKIFEVNSLLEKNNVGQHSGHIFFHMIKNLYKSLMDQIENTKEQITDIEENVFAGQESKMVASISRVNRRLLNFKEAISMHYEILRTFESIGVGFFDSKFTNNLRAITTEYVKVQNALESTREYLMEIRDTNDSLLTTKQTNVMKTLTAMTFVTVPIALITGLFGMNTKHTPLVGQDGDFLMVLSIMGFVFLFMLIVFRWKKWL